MTSSKTFQERILTGCGLDVKQHGKHTSNSLILWLRPCATAMEDKLATSSSSFLAKSS